MIGRTWVARDPKAALAWAHALPAGTPREAALAGIDAGLGIASFRSREVADTLAQTRAVPAARSPEGLLGPERDRALRQVFEKRLFASPVRAADWLSSLPAPDRTDEMVDRLAREWFAINPAAAETWLDQNIPSSVRREQLRQDVRR